MIPSNGIEREPINADTIAIASITTRKSKFNPQEMMRHESLLTCDENCLPPR